MDTRTDKERLILPWTSCEECGWALEYEGGPCTNHNCENFPQSAAMPDTSTPDANTPGPYKIPVHYNRASRRGNLVGKRRTRVRPPFAPPQTEEAATRLMVATQIKKVRRRLANQRIKIERRKTGAAVRQARKLNR